MHLASIINRLSKSESNVPVSMFVSGAERMFLRVSEDYEETVQNVARAFGIELVPNARISFSTSTLDICDGKDVVIDPTAYPFMWTVLDEIRVSVNVTIRDDDDDDEDAKTQHQGKAPQIPHSSAIPGPSLQKNPNDDAKLPPVVSQSSIPLVDSFVPRLNPIPPRLDLGKAKAKETKELPVDNLDSPQDTNDFLALDSPSDHGGEEKLPWNFRDKATPKDRGGNSSTEPKAPVGSSAKDVAPSNSFATKDVPRPQLKKEKVDEPRQTGESSPEERPELKRSPSHRSIRKAKEPSQTTADDPRFEIFIQGPERNQMAQFKMRGKHPVRKVLQAACKAFDLDYERSHLILSVPIENDNGEVESVEFECPADDTMARCGVNAESKLSVKVAPESNNK